MTTAETDTASKAAGEETGIWMQNPATGEIAHIVDGPGPDGRRLEAHLWLRPDAAVVGAHVHEHIVESFEVLEGEVTFFLDDREITVGPGRGPIQIPAGTVHDWWNSGTEVASVAVIVRAVEGSSDRPATRFLAMIKVMWSLGALGRTDSDGMPELLWLAAVGSEYRDVIRFTHPPALVQSLLFGLVAWLARRLGRDPHSPELGARAACILPESATEFGKI